MELYKSSSVHYCTNFTLTAIASFLTYERATLRVGTHLRADKGSARLTHAKNPLPHYIPLPSRATISKLHSLARNAEQTDKTRTRKIIMFITERMLEECNYIFDI
ncbi:hypothetical protein RF11_09150 [Thelohanellus kitauei]|uniref:Uncharacterized protein n=1 Tax=Thelohanellus kitauei TaxID=669202 RepID=A0A0C2MUY8_THEKT|nr:hypothetical protein RF11_09150 [Thelohanellus kitauei]